MYCAIPQGACVTVAALLQYFLMAAFCWMLVEGIYLYLLVVNVYNIEQKMCVTWRRGVSSKHLLASVSVLVHPISLFYASTAGLPVVIVALSMSIAAGKDGILSFVDDE